MAAVKSPAPPPLVLETFYNVTSAAVRLGLQNPEDPDDHCGEKWLRDGVNQEDDPFPCTRMAGQLMFSESQLAEIAKRHENQPETRGRRPARRRPARVAATV